MPLRAFRRVASSSLVTAALALGCSARDAAALSHTFSSNTSLGSGDLQYEGYDITVSNCTLWIQGPHAFNSLTVNSGIVGPPASGDTLGIQLTISGNMTIDAASRVHADSLGYASGAGPGAGIGNPATSGGGGAHGGHGGDALFTPSPGGSEYDDIVLPTQRGSGGGASFYGPGGAGGGVIALSVGGTLRIDGNLTARGASAAVASAGGGSGGTIRVVAGAITGTGFVSVQGGDATSTGGAGGGGRLSATYGSNTFSGSTLACGGLGPDPTCHGGAGTVYTKRTLSALGLARIGNCDTAGGVTTLLAPLTLTADMIVERGARLTSLAGQPMALTLSGGLTIGSTGVVSMSGRGNPSGTGPGAGHSNGSSGSGGGYAGNGSDDQGGTQLGGATYGSPLVATDMGSGGGDSFFGAGGAGGGTIALSLGTTLTVDGALQADGGNGSASDAGGGSGGSIVATCASTAGTGRVSAAGGGASGFGGSGGGGRVFLTVTTSSFTGLVRACGGTGPRPGGAGSVTVRFTAAPRPTITFSNCGLAGARSDIPVPATWNAHLVIDSLAVVSSPQQQALSLNVEGDLTVRPLGTLSVDGRGYPAYTGPGQGAGTAGGGHGGTGGNGTGVLETGGATYDDPFAPSDFGGAGGPSTGATGGGAVQLAVTGACTVDGRISADGNAGNASGSGGGAGGSIAGTFGSLAGSGTISAQGGTASNYGGSGGGGRIALTYGSTSFGGTLVACSPIRFAPVYSGGAGTIYTKLASQPRGDLLIDGCGSVGAARTDLPPGTFVWTTNLRVRNRGVLGTPAGSPLHVEITGNVTVDSLCAINADARGFAAAAGPGAGYSGANAGSGGGYGGAGGASGYGDPGGGTYGTASVPVDLGSGGGYSTYGAGGRGGGAIYLTVSDTLSVDGTVSANGGPGTNYWAGGGSGGSVYARCGALRGTGQFAANGGIGDLFTGGSGGGGRVHVSACTNAGALHTFSAAGGTAFGPVFGQPGTVYPSGGVDWYCPQPTAAGDPSAAPRVQRLAVRTTPSFARGSAATVTLAMPSAGHARLDVLDAAGRLLATLADRSFGAGEHRLVWNGRDSAGRAASSGVRFVRVTTDAGSTASALLVVR